MILIGLTGPIGHGKTTFANILTKLEPDSELIETYEVVSEVVNALHKESTKIPASNDVEHINSWLKALPTILSEVVHVKSSFDQIKLTNKDIKSNPLEYQKLFEYLEYARRHPAILDQKIDEANKAEYRSILQWVGGYMVYKVNHGVWYNELLRRAGKASQAGRQLYIIGGVRFISDSEYIHSAGGKIIAILRPGLAAQDLQVPMEYERQQIVSDTTIVNNGSLAQLEVVGRHILRDLKSEHLSTSYEASRTQ